MEFMVRRTTTDKLGLHLGVFAAEGWSIQPFFTGGRDWVLVCSR